MRIGCLQFAPLTGDVDFNLSRADSVLSKADQTALDDIDIIVCPELAFTGSNFNSLEDISPYLEPSTSGITALWARTTALRYNAIVAVGYPEKVDTETWPASPEYYNSLVVVNGDGETVANIRKRSLTASDKKWALESREAGAVSAAIEGIGQTTIGISTDLFSPSPDFEFALHAVQAASKVILVTMSWTARSEARMFSRMPSEPDMDALTSWTQQLVPLISTEGREEVIVIFCNRCGSEDGVAYSGTSAVLGIKDGAVSVYGLLGRGVKELLVVDTDNPPFARLVQADGDQPSRSQDPSSVLHQSSESRFNQSQLSPGLPPHRMRPSPASASGTSTKTRITTPPRPARHRPREGSPSPVTTRTSRAKSKIPKLQIPGHTSQGTYASAPHEDVNRHCYISGEETSPNVETPTCPSPIPDTLRPQVATRAAVSEDLFGHGNNRMPLSPTTPFLEFFRNTSPLSPVPPFCFSTSPLHSPQAPRNHDSQLFWVPPRQLLKSPTSTTMSPLDTPVDRVMSMFSVCAPTSLAAKTSQSTSKTQVWGTKPAPARPTGLPSPNTRPNAKKPPAAESPSRPCTGSTFCEEAAQPRMFSVTPSASPETVPEIQWTKTGTQSADITTSSTVSHSTVPSMGTVVSQFPDVATPLDSKPSSTPQSTVDIEVHPDTRSCAVIPGMSISARRSHSNDSFCARSSPPFTGPNSRRAQTHPPLGHPRSRSLSGSEKRGRQGNNHDSLQRITFTPGDSIADQTSLRTHGGQLAAPLVPSPDSNSHFRGRMPDIPRPSSIPRQRQPASSSFGPEIPRHSSIPRQRRATSSRGDLCSRTHKTHRLGSDPNDDIVATISKITADCPHHAVNRPMGPIVQSADGSLYTIELPQHVQDLAMSLLTKLPTDTRLDSRQSLVRKSSVW